MEDEDEEHMEGKVETTENSDTWPVISVESLLAASTGPGFQGSAHTSQAHFAAPFACDGKEDKEAIKPKGKGLKSLSEDEQHRLLAIPDSLREEVSLSFANNLTAKEKVMSFNGTAGSKKALWPLDAEAVPDAWRKTLHTPPVRLDLHIGRTPQIAESSAYGKFFEGGA